MTAAFDKLNTDLTAFFQALDAFLANVTGATSVASNDPGIQALDSAVNSKMAQLQAAALAISPSLVTMIVQPQVSPSPPTPSSGQS